MYNNKAKNKYLMIRTSIIVLEQHNVSEYNRANYITDVIMSSIFLYPVLTSSIYLVCIFIIG